MLLSLRTQLARSWPPLTSAVVQSSWQEPPTTVPWQTRKALLVTFALNYWSLECMSSRMTSCPVCCRR